MIHGIYSSKSSFKTVQFEKGLNVVIGERKETSDEKKTTNSLGKSTLISIINFCLGSDAPKSGLCINELSGWDFTIDITLLENRVQVTRVIDKPKKFIINGDTGNWPIEPEFDRDTKNRILGLEKWKQLLGLALFDAHHGSISIRSLLSYFIRSRNEAYTNPLKFFSSQPNNQANIFNTFLIGLDYRHAVKWLELDKQDKVLKALANALRAGVHETQGELEAKKVELEEELNISRKTLSDFKVHEKYKDIQIKANQLTGQLHKLANENILESRKLEHYKNSISEETPPDKGKLESIYEEAGIVFQNSAKSTLEEASNFHEKIVKNRADFLKAEIFRIENEITKRQDRILKLNNERASCMKILNTHGALEEYTRLQEENTEVTGKLQQIQNKIEEVRNNSNQRKDIKLSKLELDNKASLDYEESREHWEKAIKLFNESTKALYGVNGEFVINISDQGYHFNVDIDGGRGSGVGKMKVFCYDLMVMSMQKILKRNIDFLVHDSIIFEGVDERQIAHAIEQAANKAKEYDFQYIMAINSDIVPYNDFNEDFNFNDYIKLKLTDDDESGSLLGIRY